MSRKNSERRRKLADWKALERVKAETSLPAAKELLLELFNELDERLSATPCDHSLRFSLAWAGEAGIDRDALAEWLRENGGYCDCEVLGNVPASNAAFRR